MGQDEDRKDARQDRRANPERQEVRRYVAALVCSVGLATGGFALGFRTPTTSEPLIPEAPAPQIQSAKPVVQNADYAFNQDDAWKALLWQCEAGPRVPGTQPHLKVRDLIWEAMKPYCENVRLQDFTHVWSRTGRSVRMFNILGEQNWKDAKTRIVLLAHWDTRPSAEQDPEPDNHLKPIPGANDGASGVAILLELMKVTKEAANKDVGILYAMVDGEDLGPGLDEMFLGAKYLSEHLPEPRPNYGILLDMVGDKDLKVPVEPNSYNLAKPLVIKFYQLAKEVGLDKTFANEYGPEILDDHLSMNDAGVPTMDLIDFSYRPWHTLADTPDKCSAASLGKMGRMLEAWLKRSPAFKYPKSDG